MNAPSKKCPHCQRPMSPCYHDINLVKRTQLLGWVCDGEQSGGFCCGHVEFCDEPSEQENAR